MPRTRIATNKKLCNMNASKFNATMANQPKSITEILNEFDQEETNITNHYNQLADHYLNLISTSFDVLKIRLGDVLLHKNLYELIAESNGKKSNACTTTKTEKRQSRTLTKTNAERRARRHNNVSVTSTTRNATTNSEVTKSEGRSTMTEKNGSHKSETSVTSVPSSMTVTPKVDMNEPIAVLRRPNHGEIALSMVGSPLMVSNVARDDMPTISVPLCNGNVMTILPRLGASTLSNLFDEDTKQQLLVLSENLKNMINNLN